MLDMSRHNVVMDWWSGGHGGTRGDTGGTWIHVWHTDASAITCLSLLSLIVMNEDKNNNIIVYQAWPLCGLRILT